jgi:hypothetical protein
MLQEPRRSRSLPRACRGGLWNTLSTLRMTVTGFYARLGTGGWLTLTGYGLAENVHALGSLYKKHQGYLDALTLPLIGWELLKGQNRCFFRNLFR